MVKNIVVWVSAIAGTWCANAYANAPDFTLNLSSLGKSAELTATAPAHHHFNLQAPTALLAGKESLQLKPKSASEHEIKYEFDNHTAKTLTALTAYLCDDAKTFCEKHTVSLIAVPLTRAEPTKEVHAKNGPLKIDEHGFIDNQPEQAWALAARTKKPLLIDFYGIWCPPCNELDEQVFNQREFKNKTSSFVKLKMDADSQSSWSLKSKYKVGGYPTLVFATSQGDEILRVVGFRSQSELLLKVKEAYALRATSFDDLKTKADAGDRESSDRLGMIFADRSDWVNAIQYLKASSIHRETYLESQIELARAQKRETSDVVTAMENYLKEFEHSPDSLDVRDKLASAYDDLKQPEKKKVTLEALVAVSEELVVHPDHLKNYDMAIADVYSAQADAWENLGKDELSKSAWAKAVHEYKKKNLSDRERGFNLELAYALAKSGDSAAAHRLYQKLEKHYPHEFTFHFAHARLLFNEKRLPEAERASNEACLYGYGDNKLRAVQLLVKVYAAENKKSEAKALIEKTLKETVVPDDPEVRTHRYINALKETAKTLSLN